LLIGKSGHVDPFFGAGGGTQTAALALGRVNAVVQQALADTRLTMAVEDRKGILADVSTRIAGINTNITNIEARTGDNQQGRITMTVEISDVKHLEKVIKSLRGIAGVTEVERAAR